MYSLGKNTLVCPNCRKICEINDSFCSDCGSPLEQRQYIIRDKRRFWSNLLEVCSLFFKTRIDVFCAHKIENIIEVIAFVVLNGILFFSVPGYYDFIPKWYFMVPALGFGMAGFFFNSQNIWRQRLFKLLSFPVFFLVFEFVLGMIILLLLGGGGAVAVSGSSREDKKQWKIDMAASRMKSAAQNRATADSLIHSGDKNVSASAKNSSAFYEGEYNKALADLLEAQTGNTNAASRMRTAASNKATADVLMNSGDRNIRASAQINSAFAKGEYDSALADILKGK